MRDDSSSSGAPPQIEVEQDFDGYFEGKVRGLLDPERSPKYRVIVVNARPYVPDAVRYEIFDQEGRIRLTFYAGLRVGFGEIDWQMVRDLLYGEGSFANRKTTPRNNE